MAAIASSYADVQFSGLEALYYATNGQEWTNSAGWRDDSLGVCNWFGVTCDSKGANVTGLALPNNLLVGDVSEAAELANLTSLQEADLSNNKLFGPVPSNLGLMPNLEILDLSGNELSSFPATWGAGASMLRHLSLQNNRISGSLPAAWLDVNGSSYFYPLVHIQSTSPWMPELRSLLLGGNSMNATGYATLQTVANWRSLQTLDLSDNDLTGPVEDALTLYYYCDGSGITGCGGNTSSVAAPLLRVLKLDGNDFTGPLPRVIVDTGDRRIDVLDVSDNGNMVGAIPTSYSELLMLFAESTGLSSTDLPRFIDTTSTTAAGAWHQQSTAHHFSICPAFKPSPDENMVAVTLDHEYGGYSLCACNDGFQGSGGSCSECPLGSYRNMDEEGDGFAEGVCLVCPSYSTTLQKGRWLKGQCVCATNFYDEQGGTGSGPSCLACPSGSRTLTVGAVNITSCE